MKNGETFYDVFYRAVIGGALAFLILSSITAKKDRPETVSPARFEARMDELMAALSEVRFRQTTLCVASWYGPGFHGKQTANRERYDQDAMTVAHKTLPFGSMVLIENTRNGKFAAARVNDRGPYVLGRMIDVSRGVARQLGMEGEGVAMVKIEVLDIVTEGAMRYARR